MGLNYLDVKNLARYDYRLTEKVYKYLCSVRKEISEELRNVGFMDMTLLSVDYFITMFPLIILHLINNAFRDEVAKSLMAESIMIETPGLKDKKLD